MSGDREDSKAKRVIQEGAFIAGTGLVTFCLVRYAPGMEAVFARVREALPLDALLLALSAAAAAAAVMAFRRGRAARREARAHRQTIARLADARARSDAQARHKAAVLAQLSHEIRTPLTGVIGFAGVLREELEGEPKEIAGLIKESGERLLETLNAILDLARLDAGAVALHTDRVDVGATVQEVVRLFSRLAEARVLALVVEVPERPILALLDPLLLHRILTNLVNNGIKFTKTGTVTVRVAREGDQVRIEVQDTGIGISEAFLPHVFDEFVREETGLEGESPGSGLGLAITHSLVTHMGGAIRVQSRKGEGSTFTVVLPALSEAPGGGEDVHRANHPQAMGVEG